MSSPSGSFKPGRWSWDQNPVLYALLASLLCHFTVFFGIYAAQRFELWDKAKETALLEDYLKLLEQASPPPAEEEAPTQPTIFVDVDLSQQTEAPPEETDYYAAVNTQAADSQDQELSDIPQMDGAQDKVPKTSPKGAEVQPEDEPQPLQPNFNEDETPEPTVPEPAEPSPKPAKTPDLPDQQGTPDRTFAMAEPTLQPRPRPPQPTAQQQRPRRLPRTGRATPRLRQEGGVPRARLESSFDAMQTPFGAYDAALVRAVERRWHQLLESYPFLPDHGKAVLVFRLYHDGTVTGLKAPESSVSEVLTLLCQRAISDSAPFGPWPNDMRRLIEKDYREVKFTFYYD